MSASEDLRKYEQFVFDMELDEHEETYGHEGA